MSRRGNCSRNAVVESFFSSLKRKFVHGERRVAVAGGLEWLGTLKLQPEPCGVQDTVRLLFLNDLAFMTDPHLVGRR